MKRFQHRHTFAAACTTRTGRPEPSPPAPAVCQRTPRIARMIHTITSSRCSAHHRLCLPGRAEGVPREPHHVRFQRIYVQDAIVLVGQMRLCESMTVTQTKVSTKVSDSHVCGNALPSQVRLELDTIGNWLNSRVRSVNLFQIFLSTCSDKFEVEKIEEVLDSNNTDKNNFSCTNSERGGRIFKLEN